MGVSYPLAPPYAPLHTLPVPHHSILLEAQICSYVPEDDPGQVIPSKEVSSDKS